MPNTQQNVSYNFDFLKQHSPLFVELALAAENAFYSDPNTTLIKLRQLGEALAQHLATQAGVQFNQYTTQLDLINKLNRELRFDPIIKDLFHTLRSEGNKATHQFKTSHKHAIEGLQLTRAIATWFHQTLTKNSSFKAPPFQLPEDPSVKLRTLQTQIEQLKSDLGQANVELNNNQELNQLLAQEKSEYEQLAAKMAQQVAKNAAQTEQHEQALIKQQQAYEEKLAELAKQIQAQGEEALKKSKQSISQQSRKASQRIELSEDATRIIIDQQLKDAGWLANSEELKYSKGTRPEKGINQAIAEWPMRFTKTGKPLKERADYVLFIGLTPVAIVEAKKKNTDVAGKIDQAERYSRNVQVLPPLTGAWLIEDMSTAWSDSQEGHYQVPFVYSCNGRPYFKQLLEQSGTWFRDVRHPSNLKRALQTFHTPDGLMDLIKRNKTQAENALEDEPFGYLKLRPYQELAIQAVESTLANNVRQALLAMATGTGKTRTIIGLIYRFLKTERFNRILFLVDRTALGNQAFDDFNEAQLEQNLSLTKAYNTNEMKDTTVETETRIQVATVQAMSQRIFASDNPPPLDQFDCIIIDEAHRGYTLDQEMSDGEMQIRDNKQYLSTYRRVVDYFDAVKIALTATPAKHTTEIFGHPVYVYSYREAVADDWLIDHEPPIRYQTLLSQNGIHFDKGETVSSINSSTGEISQADLEDEMDFDVESFNRRVISENFNKVICTQLAQELDPFDEEKTMIFCATDRHADMVKRLLDQAFFDVYGDEYDQAAVMKITGKSDQVDKLIERYKNEKYPNIAITVDLLTTGIDVPKICNLVFMRRVKSRILYEQMIGRATRRCDDIGKTVFRIYDPVDLYASLEPVNTMKPVVKDPSITLEQLIQEVTDEQVFSHAQQQAGDDVGQTQADSLITQISQKVMRVLRKAEKVAETKPEVRAKLDELKAKWGVEPKELHQHLHQMGSAQAAKFLRQHQQLAQQLEQVKTVLGTQYQPIISEHEDELVNRTQDVTGYTKPEDYLESFSDFINHQINESAALSVVVNKPKDLTRAQLKEVKLLLDGHGFSEVNLQTAVRNHTNQDIAASIIGHIRRAAMGEDLLPFEDRVKLAMDKIYTRQAWLPPQKKWLERLAKQLVYEVVIDREFVNQRFADHGGAKKLDKVLNEQLDNVLEVINDNLWQAQA